MGDGNGPDHRQRRRRSGRRRHGLRAGHDHGKRHCGAASLRRPPAGDGGGGQHLLHGPVRNFVRLPSPGSGHGRRRDCEYDIHRDHRRRFAVPVGACRSTKGPRKNNFTFGCLGPWRRHSCLPRPDSSGRPPDMRHVGAVSLFLRGSLAPPPPTTPLGQSWGVFRGCQAVVVWRGMTDHKGRWSLPPYACSALSASISRSSLINSAGKNGFLRKRTRPALTGGASFTSPEISSTDTRGYSFNTRSASLLPSISGIDTSEISTSTVSSPQIRSASDGRGAASTFTFCGPSMAPISLRI